MSRSEPKSEADRLARIIFRLRGVKATIDELEGFMETHEREMMDEILDIVIGRIEGIKQTEQARVSSVRIAKKWSSR